MPRVTLEKSHSLRLQLRAGKVDSNTGIIFGTTIAKAGVQAIGKIVMVDAQGKITKDEKLARKRLPVFTDAKTLDTLMSAAADAGGKVKSREDHDDRIQARAGYTNTFARVTDAEGDRVVGDLHLFQSFRNRDIVLETAEKTPDEMGLSIDFLPDYEIAGDRALMRVVSLEAVDIVDAGAITPDGLLLSANVDTAGNLEKQGANADPKSEPEKTMPDPTIPDLMAEIQKCTAGYAAVSKMMGEHGALLAKLTAPPAKDADGDAMKAVTAMTEKLTALQTTVTDTQKSLTQMRKERALLGFRGTVTERERLAQGSPEDIDKALTSRKSYLDLVADTAATEKCSRAAAHTKVQATAEGAALYAEHLSTKGVIGRQTMAA